MLKAQGKRLNIIFTDFITDRFSRPEKYSNDYDSVIRYLSDCRECDKYHADIRNLSRHTFTLISWLYLNFINLPVPCVD